MKKFLRLIGDAHCKRVNYLKLIEKAEYSLQVGDLDIYHYHWLEAAGVDPERHRFIGGNHDNYDLIGESPHCLGDFGVWTVPGFGDIFFVRGAWSIDAKRRTPGLDWWPEEELSEEKCNQVLALYEQVKPKMVVSHACPRNVIPWISDGRVAWSWGFDPDKLNTRTDTLLQVMATVHRPRLHVFGHYHQAEDIWLDARTGQAKPPDQADTSEYTRYVCLPELGVLDFEKGFLDNL
jgi:hypothetical protein